MFSPPGLVISLSTARMPSLAPAQSITFRQSHATPPSRVEMYSATCRLNDICVLTNDHTNTSFTL